MAEQLFRVDFCCNNMNGNFRRSVQAVNVNRANGDIEIAVEGYFDRPPAMRREGRALFVSGKRFTVESDWKRHVGNLCWDAADMTLSEARRLVELLLERGFTADQWVIDGPFADIGERTLTSAEEAGRG